MGVREYDYIRGNTVVVPERQIKERESIDRRNKERQEKRKKLAQNKRKLTKDFMGMVTLMFILGAASLSVDGRVYGLQKQLSNLESQVGHEVEINEALDVELLQISSIEKVKTTAEKELGMVYPGKEGTISIDMSKEYFSHIKEVKEDKSSLLAELIGTFN